MELNSSLNRVMAHYKVIDTIEIRLGLSRTEFVSLFRKYTSKSQISWQEANRKFQGAVTGNSFRLLKLSYFDFSLSRYIVEGEIEAKENHLLIRCHLNSFYWQFRLFFYFLVIAFIINSFSLISAGFANPTILLWLPFGLLLLLITLWILIALLKRSTRKAGEEVTTEFYNWVKKG